MIYKHKVQYYETDQMAVVHHSNYIRWMEEARIFYLDEIGADFASMEQMGITSPVLAVDCEYLSMTRFGDTVLIDAEIEEFKGVKMTVRYEMKSENTGEVVFAAKSKHCFMKDGKIVNLKKKFPEIYAKFGLD